MISQLLIPILALLEVLGAVGLFGFLIREIPTKHLFPRFYCTAALVYLGTGLFCFAMMTVFAGLAKTLFVLSLISLMIHAGYAWLIVKK